MKKLIIVTSLILFTGAFLFSANVFAQDVTEIDIWFARDAFIPDDHFETFHEDNPDIKVNVDMIPLGDAPTEFMRAHRAQQAPDIVQVNFPDPHALAAQNMLLDISSVYETWEEEDPEHYNQMAKATWEFTTIDGAPRGMTLFQAPHMYVYRKDIFEEEGIDVPETWEEVIEAGKALRTDDMLGFSLLGASRQRGWIMTKGLSVGIEMYDGKYRIDGQAGRYLIELYQRFMREGIVHSDAVAWDSGDMRAAFLTGGAAQANIAFNIFPTIQEEMEYGVEWAAKALPYRPGAEDKHQIGSSYWPFVVNSHSEEKIEAIGKVFRYLADEEIAKSVAIRYQPTTNLAVYDDPEFREAQPWWDDLMDVYEAQTSLAVGPHTMRVHEIMGELQQHVLLNPYADPAEIAERFQEEMDGL